MHLVYIYIYIYIKSPRLVVANVLDYDIVESDFDSSHDIAFTFGLIALEKVRKTSSSRYVLKNSPMVFLKGWLWH